MIMMPYADAGHRCRSGNGAVLAPHTLGDLRAAGIAACDDAVLNEGVGAIGRALRRSGVRS
jgi:hypothetical protein